MKKLNFKAENNQVVAWREHGRVSEKHIETTNNNPDLERLCRWAYELGRRDRQWELENFLKGEAVEAIFRVI